MQDWLKYLPIAPIHFIYGAIAFCGGIARYLSNYTKNRVPFNFSMFLASTFVSGFSGYMFALVGLSLALPDNMLFIMAGAGGFFGEQTMKLVMEYTSAKIN